ncbi:MAG: hypothetical protein JWP27_2738 [Flaviaesturariibacter sp.]|nr:hypothetical protein [Flaviaesturariibacter sp.]
MEKKVVNLSPQLIEKLGLTLSTDDVNAATNPDARVFRYPTLDRIYIMESDLYGNPMPANSCFLAFTGRNGLMGRHITIDALSKTSAEGIKQLVQDNTQG